MFIKVFKKACFKISSITSTQSCVLCSPCAEYSLNAGASRVEVLEPFRHRLPHFRDAFYHVSRLQLTEFSGPKDAQQENCI